MKSFLIRLVKYAKSQGVKKLYESNVEHVFVSIPVKIVLKTKKVFFISINRLGNLTIHADECGGGNSIFIATTLGKLIYMSHGFAVLERSPYLDSFGEEHDGEEYISDDIGISNSSSSSISLHKKIFYIYNIFSTQT